MMRRHQDSHGENHERWLISYADFITLLFALFVVLFASSRTDRQKLGEAVKRAFSGERAPKVTKVLGGTVGDIGQGNRMMRGPGGANIYTPLPAQLVSTELLPSEEFLNRELAEEIAARKLTIHMEARGMVITLPEAGYFLSGDDRVSSAAYPVINKIAATILKTVNPIRLEGHTDDVPIHNARFRSNWDLSTARAVAMLEALRDQFDVPVQRMAVAGYADNFPIDSNDNPEGRARNRRVDIIILSQSGLVSLPQSSGSTSPEPAPAGVPKPSEPPAPGSPTAPLSR